MDTEVPPTETEADNHTPRKPLLTFPVQKVEGADEYPPTINYDGPRHIKPILMEMYDKIEDVVRTGARITGLTYGYFRLDEFTQGLHPGELVVVGGCTGTGKTAFCLNVASTLALNCLKPVLFFTLQSSRMQMTTRILCALAGVFPQDIKQGDLKDEEWARVTNAVSRACNSALFIDETLQISVEHIRKWVQLLTTELGPFGLVIVDGLQEMAEEKGTGRDKEVNAHTRALSVLAKEMQLPIIATSQTSNAADERSDKSPQLSDFGYWNGIPEIADAVLMLHQPGLVVSRRTGAVSDLTMRIDLDDEWLASVHIIKHRTGEKGRVDLCFDPAFSRFSDIGPHAYAKY